MIRILLLTSRGEVARVLEPPVTLGEAAAFMPEGSPTHAALGIWGQIKPPSTILNDGDRVECYEALRADPKVARRKKVVRPKGFRMGKM